MAKITDKMTRSNWPRIILTNVKVNGNSAFVYTTAGLFETQRVILQKAGLPDLPLYVAAILDERYVILRAGKQVSVNDVYTQYDDCLLTAPDQARPPTETDPQQQAFQEFPAAAYRELQVSHHGNPTSAQAGVLDLEDVQVRIIYNEAFQVQEIREFEKHPYQRYLRPFTTTALTSTFTFTESLMPFMKEVGNQILYYEEQEGSISNPAVYTITGFNEAARTIQVSPPPPDRASPYSKIDARLGNRLKSTKFDGIITVDNIDASEWELVLITDIIGDVGIV